jgi:hypothetical protein
LERQVDPQERQTKGPDMTDERPELDPQIGQREDGVVIEPGSEIDEDLQEHTSDPDQAQARPGDQPEARP